MGFYHVDIWSRYLSLIHRQGEVRLGFSVDQLTPCEARAALYRQGEWRPGSLHHWPHRVQSSVPWYQGEPSEFSGTLGPRSSAPL